MMVAPGLRSSRSSSGNQPVVQDHLGLAKATQSLDRDQLRDRPDRRPRTRRAPRLMPPLPPSFGPRAERSRIKRSEYLRQLVARARPQDTYRRRARLEARPGRQRRRERRPRSCRSPSTLQPCRPTSAVWWLPQEAGQPDQRTLIGRVAVDASARARGRARCARVLVSISARLQKSVPVHETSPRCTSEGLYGSSAQRLRGQIAQPRVGTCGTSTFCDGVSRSSPARSARRAAPARRAGRRDPAHRAS